MPPPRQSLVTPQLLDALAIKESRRNPQAVGDHGQSVGEYQMKRIAYADVQHVFPQEFGAIPYERLKTDRALQRRAAKAYLQVGEQKYGITDVDRLVSFYNRGPKARLGPITNQPYVDDVKRLLEGDNPMPQPAKKPIRVSQDFNRGRKTLQFPDVSPSDAGRIVGPPSAVAAADPIERAVLRIGRLTRAAGFGRLLAKDIAPMLARLDPPGVLPGVTPPKPDRVAQDRQLTSFLHQALRQGQAPKDAGSPASFLASRGA